MTAAQFAEKIGISPSSLSHILSGRNNPSLEVVMKIHKACDYISLDWLLYGEGQMETDVAVSYTHLEVPALPAFMLQRAVSSAIRDHARDYWTGTVYTTNRSIWEHDEGFKKYLLKTRAMCVDMETATLFTTGFYNHIPTGALLLVSDQPMIPEGVKTEKSDSIVTVSYTHLDLAEQSPVRGCMVIKPYGYAIWEKMQR